MGNKSGKDKTKKPKQNRHQPDLQFTFLFLGEYSVGKTTLVTAYTRTDFRSAELIPSAQKNIEVDGRPVTVSVWDPSPNRQSPPETAPFRLVQKTNLCSVVIVCDVTNTDSFDCLQKYFELLKRTTPKDTIKYLVANKCDLLSRLLDNTDKNIIQYHDKVNFLQERAVTKKELEDYIASRPDEVITLVETNATSNESVEAFFDIMVNKLIELNPKQQQ